MENARVFFNVYTASHNPLRFQYADMYVEDVSEGKSEKDQLKKIMKEKYSVDFQHSTLYHLETENAYTIVNDGIVCYKIILEKAEETAPEPVKRKAGPQLLIQAGNGLTISTEELLAKVGAVDAIYVKPEENRAYWVLDHETGSVNLW